MSQNDTAPHLGILYTLLQHFMCDTGMHGDYMSTLVPMDRVSPTQATLLARVDAYGGSHGAV